MKVEKLIKKLYKACIRRDKEKEQEFWAKLLKKSIKGKNTTAVR